VKRSAVLAFPDDQGEPQARLILERVKWGDGDEAAYARQALFGTQPATAAWLMCNPSRADAKLDDPTAGRVVGHSARFGCPRSLVGNVWCLRTPYPVDLWRMLARGDYSPTMDAANLDALAMIGAQADVHIAAFGAEPARRFPSAVYAALEAFTNGGAVPLYCLGATHDRQPLHPLARGKLAIPRDVQLQEWSPRLPLGGRSWDDVFSDCRKAGNVYVAN
jgi:hypothetical protein